MGMAEREEELAEDVPEASSAPSSTGTLPSSTEGGVMFVLEKASLEVAKVGKVSFLNVFSIDTTVWS